MPLGCLLLWLVNKSTNRDILKGRKRMSGNERRRRIEKKEESAESNRLTDEGEEEGKKRRNKAERGGESKSITLMTECSLLFFRGRSAQ